MNKNDDIDFDYKWQDNPSKGFCSECNEFRILDDDGLCEMCIEYLIDKSNQLGIQEGFWG